MKTILIKDFKMLEFKNLQQENTKGSYSETLKMWQIINFALSS